jgi:hypothetical protein
LLMLRNKLQMTFLGQITIEIFASLLTFDRKLVLP